MTSSTLARNAGALWSIMGPRRRLQLFATLGLMMVGAVAELVTIGAVLPLLAIAADPGNAERIPLLRTLLNQIGAARHDNLIVPAAIFLVAAALASAALRLMLSWATQKFVFGLQYDIAKRAYERILRQPYEAFVRQHSSIAISAIEKIYLVTNGVVMPVMLGVTSAGIAAFILVFLFVIDPATAAIASASMGLIYVMITIATRRLLLTISRRSATIRTARVKLVQESLGGIRDIILDHSHAVFERKQAAYENEMRRLQILVHFISASPRFIVEGSGIILVALLSIYFSWQPGGILAALPVLGALALGAQRLLPLLQAMYLGWASYSIHAHNLQDVVDLLRMPAEPAPPVVRGEAIKPFTTSIELRGLSFGYGDSKLALEDIDLVIAKGERIGLIGKTGSGKSTLVDVLMGLLQPTSGELLIDGVPVRRDTIGNWQAQIAHVPQSIFLSDDSIAANIAFGVQDGFDMAKLWDAAERADIRSFIETLPDGMDTKVGERGIRLSGGQRQRLGIARALYRNATVLILDEATSALDDSTEAAVMESVAGLGRDLTMVLIAHRLSTVAECDTIYRMDGGRIVQKGPYEEVVGQAPRTRRRG